MFYNRIIGITQKSTFLRRCKSEVGRDIPASLFFLLLSKMKLSLYLKSIAPLTLKQYGVLRDAGWEKDEIENVDSFSYQRIRADAQYDSSTAPAKERQLIHVRRRGIEIDVSEPTYGMLRAIIRSIAKAEGDDQRYLQYVDDAEDESRKRKMRRESAKARAQG